MQSALDFFKLLIPEAKAEAQPPQPPTAPTPFQDKKEEQDFLEWYKNIAELRGLNPNPDDPSHFYDYRAAYKKGQAPDESGHWPSENKLDGHPNLIVDGVNTKTGEPAATPTATPNPAENQTLTETVQNDIKNVPKAKQNLQTVEDPVALKAKEISDKQQSIYPTKTTEIPISTHGDTIKLKGGVVENALAAPIKAVDTISDYTGLSRALRGIAATGEEVHYNLNKELAYQNLNGSGLDEDTKRSIAQEEAIKRTPQYSLDFTKLPFFADILENAPQSAKAGEFAGDLVPFVLMQKAGGSTEGLAKTQLAKVLGKQSIISGILFGQKEVQDQLDNRDPNDPRRGYAALQIDNPSKVAFQTAAGSVIPAGLHVADGILGEVIGGLSKQFAGVDLRSLQQMRKDVFDNAIKNGEKAEFNYMRTKEDVQDFLGKQVENFRGLSDLGKASLKNLASSYQAVLKDPRAKEMVKQLNEFLKELSTRVPNKSVVARIRNDVKQGIIPRDIESLAESDRAKLQALTQGQIFKALGDLLKKSKSIKSGIKYFDAVREKVEKELSGVKTLTHGLPVQKALGAVTPETKTLFGGEVGLNANKAIAAEEKKFLEIQKRKAREQLSSSDRIAQNFSHMGDALNSLYKDKINDDLARATLDELNTKEGADQYLKDIINSVVDITKGFADTVFSKALRAYIPSINLLESYANTALLLGSRVSANVAAALRDGVFMSTARYNERIGRYLVPLKEEWEKKNILSGTSMSRALFDVLNKIPHSFILENMAEFKAAADPGKALIEAAVKRFTKPNETRKQAAIRIFGEAADSVSDIMQGKNNVVFDSDVMNIMEKSIVMLREFAKKEGLSESETIDGYMQHIWGKTYRPTVDRFLKLMEKNNRGLKPLNENVFSGFLEKRYGKNGYVRDFVKSMESRIEGHATLESRQGLLDLIGTTVQNKEAPEMVKEIAHNIAERIVGQTSELEGLGSGIIDRLNGYAIKQLLNNVSFGELNLGQIAYVFGEYGGKVMAQTTRLLNKNRTLVARALKSLNVYGTELGSSEFMEVFGGKLPPQIAYGSSRELAAVKESVANTQAQFTKEQRDFAQKFFQGGILELTENNNIITANLAAIVDVYGADTEMILKQALDPKNVVLREKLGRIALEAKNNLILVGESLNKSLIQDTPFLRTAFSFTQFPVRASARIFNWLLRSPEKLARFNLAQVALFGPRAIEPPIPDDYINKENKGDLYKWLDENNLAAYLGQDFGERAQAVSFVKIGSTFGIPKEVWDTVTSPDGRWKDKLLKFGAFSPWLIAGTGANQQEKIRNTFFDDKSAPDVESQLSFVSKGGVATIFDPETGGSLEIVRNKFPTDAVLQAFGAPKTTQYAKGIMRTEKTIQDISMELKKHTVKEKRFAREGKAVPPGELMQGRILELKLKKRTEQALALHRQNPLFAAFTDKEIADRIKLATKKGETRAVANDRASILKLIQIKHATAFTDEDKAEYYNFLSLVRQTYVGNGLEFKNMEDFNNAKNEKLKEKTSLGLEKYTKIVGQGRR